MVLFDGGYAKGTPFSSTGYGFTLYYYNKDHLGNNREVLNYSGNVQQLTNYYPFGAPYTDPEAVMGSSIQQYKYNGKELVMMHGLNTYDYGARQYDPILCRWDRVDPLAEKYYPISPYAYCEYDPVNAIDPDGRGVLSKGAKLIWKVGKQVAKKGLSALKEASTYTSVFTDVKDDFNTLTDGNASTWDRVVAGISLATEILPVSLSDGKQIKNAVSSSRRGNNIKTTTKSARFVTDSKGNTIDTHKTPSGSYIQPNGDRTDILQAKPHFNKKEKRNDGFSHTHPKETNIDGNGVEHTKMSDDTHQPTYDEIKNIENGQVQKIH